MYCDYYELQVVTGGEEDGAEIAQERRWFWQRVKEEIVSGLIAGQRAEKRDRG